MLDKDKRNQTLKELANSAYGRALFDYIEERIDKLSDITNATEENLKARQETVRELRDMFKFLTRVSLDNKDKSNIQYT